MHTLVKEIKNVCVMTKQDELCLLISSSNSKVLLLMETWQNGDTCNSEMLPDHPNLCIFRCDRSTRCGDCVLIIAVKEDIPSTLLSVDSQLEAVGVCSM